MSASTEIPQGHNRHVFCQPGDEPNQVWMLTFSDPDMRTMIWTESEMARDDAIAAWNLYNPAWSCYLFATVDRSTFEAGGACDGCGSTASMASLKAAGKIACCPERKMLSAAQWRARAVAAETRYTASGYVEIEERQLGQDRWKVLINRNGQRTLWEGYPTQARAEVGKREAQEYLERVASTLPQPEAWVIINADETQYRVMDQGWFQWTDDLANAMFFATRASADQAAAEDPDDVRIVKRPIPKEA
jgi:hypothetical protein